MINIVGSSRYKLNKKKVSDRASVFLAKNGIADSSVLNVVFVGKIKMRQVANTYKHEDVALPVLAFPYNETDNQGEHMLGEVIICYPQAVLLAAEREKPVDETISQLLEHGIQNILRS